MIRFGVLWRMYRVARQACGRMSALRIALAFESLTRKNPEACEQLVREFTGVRQ